MLLIMLGHTHLRLSPFLNTDVHHSQFLPFFWEMMVSCIATTGVGVFIAISGWFGIRFKKEGLWKYIFQVLFVLWVIYGLSILFQTAEFNVYGVKVSLSFFEGYWFVIGYLGLYLISPVLNAFIDNASKKEYQIVLLSFYLFQGYYSWMSAWYDYYNGYSIILFAGIYLTAAYLKKYPVEWMEKRSAFLLILLVLFMTFIASASYWYLGHAARQLRDDNPLIILTSILMLLTFKKMKCQSSLVNWLAASCFAVYLIHFNPFVYPYLMHFMSGIYSQYDGVIYAMLLFAVLSSVYLICTLFDQVRVLAWNSLHYVLDKH